MNDLNVIATAKYLAGESIDYVVAEWKLSTKEANALRILINYRDQKSKYTVKDLLNLVMNNLITKDEAYLILRFDNDIKLIREWESIKFPEFPVRGQDLLDLGLKGKSIGDALKAMRNSWVNSNFTLTKQDLINNVSLY